MTYIQILRFCLTIWLICFRGVQRIWSVSTMTPFWIAWSQWRSRICGLTTFGTPSCSPSTPARLSLVLAKEIGKVSQKVNCEKDTLWSFYKTRSPFSLANPACTWKHGRGHEMLLMISDWSVLCVTVSEVSFVLGGHEVDHLIVMLKDVCAFLICQIFLL